jgi:tetratricopeptide (TPR) repeat protein
VRKRRDDGPDIVRQLRDVDALPLHEVAKRLVDDLSLLVKARGVFEKSAGGLLDRCRTLRGWASWEKREDTGPASSTTHSGAWFGAHIDLVEGCLRTLAGDAERAEPLFHRISASSPEVIGLTLWHCGMHELSALYVRRGDTRGINGFSQLVETSVIAPVWAGPTYYCFAELLRYFLDVGRPHPRLSLVLEHPQIRRVFGIRVGKTLDTDAGEENENQADSAESEGPWRRHYGAAFRAFRGLAIDGGVGSAEELDLLVPQSQSFWERPPDPVPPALPRWGALSLVAAGDIKKPFGVDPETYQVHQRLQYQRDEAWARRESDGLPQARAILSRMLAAATEASARDAQAASFVTAVKQDIEDVEREIRLADQRNLAEQEKNVFESIRDLGGQSPEQASRKLRELRAEATVMEPDPSGMREAVLDAEEEAVAEQRRNEQRKQLPDLHREIADLIDQNQIPQAELRIEQAMAETVYPQAFGSLKILIRRKKARSHFNAGLGKMESKADEAEAEFEAAADQDPRYDALITPLIVATRIFHDKNFKWPREMKDVAAYRRDLRGQAQALLGIAPQRREAADGIWTLIEQCAVDAVRCGGVNNEGIDALVAQIRDEAAKSRDANVHRRAIGVLQAIQRELPEYDTIDSPVEDARHRLAMRRDLCEARVLRAAKKYDEAAEAFESVVKELPSEPDAWQGLAECRVAAHSGPRARLLRVLKHLHGKIHGLKEEGREEQAASAKTWIDEQIDLFEVGE